jgi:hypothetical protein
VEYIQSASTVECRFINQSDTSIKRCSLEYGQCGQTLEYVSHEKNSTEKFPNNIVLNVDAAKLYCYVVTASSNTYIVKVEGRTTITGELRL